jgi:hypothetical protein
MKASKPAIYAVCLLVGGALALLVGPSIHKESAFAATPEEVVSAEVLEKGSTLYESVAHLAQQLEDGSAGLQGIIDTTALLIECLQLDMSHSTGEIQLPLALGGKTFGHLSLPGEQPDGLTDWVFELSIPALHRYENVADRTDVSITYRGLSGAVVQVAVLAQTHVHKREATIMEIGSAPFVTGGGLVVNDKSSTWQSLILTVEVQASGIPLWTSEVSEGEPREEALGAADSDSIAAVLFSL